MFHIEKFKEEITEMEGFGEKSFNNLVSSVNKARKTTASRLLYSLGIPGIGVSNARIICRKFGDDWSKIQNADFDQLIEIDGIGDIMAKSYADFFGNEKKRVIVMDILAEVELETVEESKEEQIFQDSTFVITGSVEQFKNRDELKEVIEQRGGKVTGSVTSKTNYLINNDNMSNSSKNKKAKELGVRIITEDEFVNWLNNGVVPE